MKSNWITPTVLGTVMGLGLTIAPSHAAEKVIVKYGTFQDTIAVSELKTFAETGQASLKLQLYMMVTNVNSNSLRTALSQTVRVIPSSLDSVLINPIGQLALDRLGSNIYQPGTTSSREALAFALIKSASNDGKISLVETLEKYPTSEVQLNADKILNAVQPLQALERPFNSVWNLIKGRL